MNLLLCCCLFFCCLSCYGLPDGFVTTQGTTFELDGKPFYFIGANSYWLPLLSEKDDVESTISTMHDAGVTVLRTWGFNAINASELAGALETKLTYYQVWNSSEWILNDGPQGLQRLDYVIETAARYDIKVILTMSNNWVGYGGLELYIDWIAGPNNTHDVFYSNPSIIASYQRYVKTIVDRYKDSPAILAWELMNEARCLGDLPSGPACPAKGLISQWYLEQSDFVRSLDAYHLITTGGEGHFFWKTPVEYWYNGSEVSDYNFNGQAGEDFDKELTFKNIDFGTYHMYPQTWYPELDTPADSMNFTVENWGLGWITYHAAAAKAAKKPLVLEEFGVTGLTNKTDIYPVWINHALDLNHGIMPWQFGMLGLTEDGGNKIFKYTDALINGASPNDGFSIYKNETELWNIFIHAAAVQKSRSQ